jgi:UDP-N-acetylglucosamine 2-epimerase (non-hydrolysing)
MVSQLISRGNKVGIDSRKTIHLIAAARPNFMKIAPLFHALKAEQWADPLIVHTGQHYDLNMSDAFFTDLGLPPPHVHLGIGSGSHAEQTGKVMIAYEKLITAVRPALSVVVGDVNSTVAASLAAVKLGVKVAHLEAGLRSFDRTMPEEINRVVTDALADLLWTPSPDGDENLLREGVDAHKIVRVGNIMIDSLEMMRNKIEEGKSFRNYGYQKKGYGLVTLHRPSNVDSPEILERLVDMLLHVSDELPLVFPVHPRTKKNLESAGLDAKLKNGKSICLVEPLSYIPFMSLVFNCRLAITDSGGIQEETTYLGIPCLTLRQNTERPITVTQGTNRLCNLDDVEDNFHRVIQNHGQERRVPEFWDGCTADRVVGSIRQFLAA